MRIGIDGRMMGKGFGIGRYVEQLVFSLLTNYEPVRTYPSRQGEAEVDELRTKDFEFVLFLRSQEQMSAAKCQMSRRRQGFGGQANVKCVIADIPWYSFAEQTKLPGIIKQAKVDLMHFPHWNVPLAYNDPFVVTIHDLTMFHFPRPEATTLGPLKFWFKDKAHRLVLRHAVKAARQIITTSEFTKMDVHRTLGVPLEKMTTIYQAPFKENAECRMQNAESVLKKYGIQKPFVLYVGAAYPHKNLDGLIKAWEIFNKKYNGNYQLVLVGKEDYFYKRIKLSAVSFTGLISDDELSVVYESASLFICPSLYEGFGLPPLEAMVYGVPVVSSNRSCLPEILGEAALYFDPENYEQIADTIYKGLTDADTRFELTEKGRRELKRYSGEKLVHQTLAVYRPQL